MVRVSYEVDIPAGAFVMQYVGEMICRATMEGRSRHNSRRGYHNYCMEIVQDEWDWEDNWKLPCIDSLVSHRTESSPAPFTSRCRDCEKQAMVVLGYVAGVLSTLLFRR